MIDTPEYAELEIVESGFLGELGDLCG